MIFALIFSKELEWEFLQLLQFNAKVLQSVFLKYYFELCSLTKANKLAYPSELLSREMASSLQAHSLDNGSGG